MPGLALVDLHGSICDSDLEYDSDSLNSNPVKGISKTPSVTVAGVVAVVKRGLTLMIILVTLYFPKYYYDTFGSMYYRQPYTALHWIFLLTAAKLGPTDQDGLAVICLCVFITGSMLLWPLQVSYVAFALWAAIKSLLVAGRLLYRGCLVVNRHLDAISSG